MCQLGSSSLKGKLFQTFGIMSMIIDELRVIKSYINLIVGIENFDQSKSSTINERTFLDGGKITLARKGFISRVGSYFLRQSL